jgi:hypothetical protein
LLSHSTAKLQKKDGTFGHFNRKCYFCRKINNDGRQFTRIPMVLPIRHGGILPMPDKEGDTECVLVGLLVLVLLTGRYQDDHPAYHPNHGVLVVGKGHLSLYGEEG